jgi:septum site-determining protein MinD
MAGYVCTIAGGKGGVGKTTTAVNIAAALEDEGYETVVVDADLGMANLGEMLGLDPDGSLHEILAGNSTVSQALTDAAGGITAIPGEQSLEAFAEADPAELKTVINTLQEAYDVVLVDTGAGLSHETMVPLGLADGVLLVTTPAELAERVDGKVIGALITRVTADTDVKDIEETLPRQLLGGIPVDIEATENEPLVINSPESDAAEAYRNLSDALARVFFEDADEDDLDDVFVLQEEWFIDEEEEEEEDDGMLGGLF